MKVSGELPLLSLDMSDKRLQELLSLVDRIPCVSLCNISFYLYRMKVSGELPLLSLDMSDKRLQELLSLVDSIPCVSLCIVSLSMQNEGVG